MATEQFAEQVGERIEAEIAARGLDARVLGPAEAPIAKLQGKYRFHMLATTSFHQHDVEELDKPPLETWRRHELVDHFRPLVWRLVREERANFVRRWRDAVEVE